MAKRFYVLVQRQKLLSIDYELDLNFAHSVHPSRCPKIGKCEKRLAAAFALAVTVVCDCTTNLGCVRAFSTNLPMWVKFITDCPYATGVYYKIDPPYTG